MATLLQTEAPAGSGFLHNPLFVVSGAIQVFRALENLRQATAAAQTATYTDDPSSSSQHLQHHQLRHPRRQQEPHQQDGISLSRMDLGKSHSPPPSTSPGSRLPPFSASPPPKSSGSGSFAPWKLQSSARDDDASAAARGRPAAPAPVIATGFAAIALPSEECCSYGSLHSHPHPHIRDDGSWEDLAAFHVSALASGHLATWPAASSSASSASSASSSSSSAEPSSEPSIDTPRTNAAHLCRPRHGGPSHGGVFSAHPGPLLHDNHQHHYRRRSLPMPALPRVGPTRGEGRSADGQQAPGAAAAPAAIAVAAAREGEPVAGSRPQWLQMAYTLAGATSRTAAQMAIHPLDTLKTRMQVRMPTPQLQVWRAVMSCPAARPRALAAWAGAAGARDLLLGLGACVAGMLPSAAIYFATEPWVRARMGEATSSDGESPLCRLTASAAAATLSALIRVPADVVKHRVQAYAYPSSTGAVRSILATRGPAGLYAGFGATLLRDAPEIVIQFTVYRKLKAVLDDHRRWSRDGDGGGAVEHLFLGGAAGAAAALATTPLDVIKTQLQCGAAASVPAAAAAVLRAGGPAALFGGLAPRLLQTTLCSALFFTCFEASKARLKDLADAGAAAAAPATPMTAPVAPPWPPPPAAAAAAAREAAAALKTPLVLPPQQHRRSGRRRSRCHDGSGAAAAAAAAAAAGAAPAGVDVEIWEGGVGAAGGRLAPVALYAYAYAGAAAPAAAAAAAVTGAAAAAAATAAAPGVMQF